MNENCFNEKSLKQFSFMEFVCIRCKMSITDSLSHTYRKYSTKYSKPIEILLNSTEIQQISRNWNLMSIKVSNVVVALSKSHVLPQ